MLHERLEGADRTRKSYHVTLTNSPQEVREAQRLRYKVFAEEMGARLTSPEPGLDIDIYDPYCEHLLVRDADTEEVVGTYRILSPEAAIRIGNYYTEQEFDLTRLQHLRGRMVELGRSCVHPQHRSGVVISLLWSQLAEYMQRNHYEYLIGCASISMCDGGHNAAALWHALKERHMAPVEWHVFPRCPLPLEVLEIARTPMVPPLIKGYLRAGAYVCGNPAWDPDFNTADLPILMPLAQVSQRYAKHYLGHEYQEKPSHVVS